MTLHLHRAPRTDRLADDLADVLATPLPDPFATEVVSVPTPGVERWLAQYLSHRLGTSHARRGDGVAAGFAFWSLPRLVGVALAHVVDPETDPWQPERLCWAVLAELDANAAELWAAPVATYLGLRPTVDGAPWTHRYRQGRRWATARRLAGLFHRYGVSRPELIEHWLAGRDTDASGRDLPADRAWQAELWRRVRRRIGRPSGAERLAGACADLKAHPEHVDLPARLSVFGTTRLTREQLRVLSALAAHRDVHLWLPHPSAPLWERIAGLPATDRPVPRRDDPSAGAAYHPLLAYLSRDSRELQRALAAQLDGTTVVHPAAVASRPDTLLGRLQSDLAADTVSPAAPLAADDTSLAVHAAHGPDRQVEVLRDVLVGLLADDPTLEPRDIVVMCPDIETFAPLLAAAFGLSQPESDLLGADHPGHRLRVRLADRSLRQLNPLLGLVARLIDLAQSRVTASQVLDLCATDAVMRKFGLSDDDLDKIADLVRTSGVRWGLDTTHRDRYGLGSFPHNTWRVGLDRMLLGVTMDGSDGTYIGTTLPLDDVDSGDVERVGRLTELLERLRCVVESLSGWHRIGHWLTVLTDAIDALAAVPSADSWQVGHAYAALAGLAGPDAVRGTDDGDGADAPDEVLLTLADVRALLADTLRGRPTRANFRTGSLTMCTLLPMRSVPQRVVCLLGVDDGVFPRRAADDGDDLLAAEPWVGDRDPRSEDRQLLLDAVLAAEERLVIIYSGADPRTNAAKPPAAPVGALLDAVDAAVAAPAGHRGRELVTVRHHLQPFDPGNFSAHADPDHPEPAHPDPAAPDPAAPDPAGTTVGPPVPRSFDRAALAGARALVADREDTTTSPWAVDRLPDPEVGAVGLDDLVRFFRHPVRAFLRLRAGLYVGSDEEADSDEIPIEPDGLGGWQIGERLLQLRLRGVPLDTAVQTEWRRGGVPPKVLGATVVDRAAARTERIVAAARPYLDPARRSVDVDVELPHGRVTGTIALHGDAVVLVAASRAKPKRQLDAWIQLLAAAAVDPGRPVTAAVLGPGDAVRLGPVPADVARTLLDELLVLYREGLCEPLPFAANTSAEYVQGVRAGLPPGTLKANVGKQWGWDFDPAYARFFASDVQQLVTVRKLPDGGTRPSEFRAIATRVFTPLIEARG